MQQTGKSESVQEHMINPKKTSQMKLIALKLTKNLEFHTSARFPWKMAISWPCNYELRWSLLTESRTVLILFEIQHDKTKPFYSFFNTTRNQEPVINIICIFIC